MKAIILLALALCVTAGYPPLDNVMSSQVPRTEEEGEPRNCKIPDIYDLDVDPDDTPSPITVNECLENGLQRDDASCPKLHCRSDCVIPDLDSRGCLKSCFCKSSGLVGDIMMTEEDVAMFGSNRAASRKMRRWTKVTGQNQDRKFYIVYYTIDSSLASNPRAQNAINAARAAYFNQTCIHFAPKPEGFAGDYINFFAGRGCYSYVGRLGRGKQQLSIGRGCEYKGTAMHEMMHAMGFWHEQSRPDRDDYVTINWDNIRDGKGGNFKKKTTTQVNSFNSPYDIGSLMQYGGKYFSKNRKPTIVEKATGKAVKAQRKGFAQSDIEQLRAMYNCDNM